MTNHYYNQKKPCPAICNDIVITDEIKLYVLDNRIYRVPVAIQPRQTPKPKGKSVNPKSLRIKVWDVNIGLDHGRAKCLCCESTEITQFDFDCGHIVAEACGGPTKLDNLLPICSSCNRSMHNMNLYEFKKQKFPETMVGDE